MDIDLDKNVVVGFDGDGRPLNCRGEIVPLPDRKKGERMRVTNRIRRKINQARKEIE